MYEQRIYNEINENEINKYELGMYACRTAVRYVWNVSTNKTVFKKTFFIAPFLGCAEKPWKNIFLTRFTGKVVETSLQPDDRFFSYCIDRGEGLFA